MNTEGELKNESDLVYVDAALQDLIPEFLSNRRKDVIALEAALQTRDSQKIQSIGHTLKGVGGSYGFNQLSTWGKQLEALGKSNDVTSVVPLVEQMKHHLSVVQVVYFGNP